MRDALALAAVGLALRLVIVGWAAPRFPASEDGRFYYVLASRLAEGRGYTWAWPDGVVTYVAHYPVGYPALVAAAFAVVGTRVAAAMVVNALLGAAAVFAVHRVAATQASRAGAIVAALGVALHPGLLFYTPALMTEGVTAACLVVAAWLACRARAAPGRAGRLVALGTSLGIATLIRPQSLLLAPVYGAWSARGAGAFRRLAGAGLVTACSVAVCVPWTIRNCHRMNACVVVSANAGWNLYIGAAPGTTGTWAPLEQLGVPPECRTVWGEAEKDACFGRAGRRAILAAPLRWLALIPRKLAATFDYAGAAGWYLHSSNPSAFDEADKLSLGVVETIWQRLLVLLSLLAVWKLPGPRAGARGGIAGVSVLLLFTKSAWISHLGLLTTCGLLGRSLARWPAVFCAGASLAATAFAHAIFFGAGRYSVVCFPLLAGLAGCVLTAKRGPGDTEDPG
jgi:4-amino-4-deoxy-L-arabinose transferase-like glycosyltransferase